LQIFLSSGPFATFLKEFVAFLKEIL